MRTVLVLASVMLSMSAFADITPPGNPDLCEQNPGNPHCHDDGGNGGNGGGGGSSVVDVVNTNTNTNDNSNTNENWQGQAQGQIQGQIQGQVAEGGDAVAYGGNVYIGGGEEGEGGSTLSPTATSDASVNVGDTTLNNDSTSVSGAIATGGEGGDASIYIGGAGEGQEGEEGGNGAFSNENNVDNSSSANATVESGAVVVENNVTVEGGEQIPQANNQTVEGDDTDINVDARTINEAVEAPVNSVAPSFSGICNSGAAGQSRGFALSLAVTNDVCQALMIADAYMALGDVEEAHKWVRAAARHAGWKGGLGYVRHLVTLGIL